MSADVPVLHPRTTLSPAARCSACGHTSRDRRRDWHLLVGVLLGGVLTSGSMLLTQSILGRDAPSSRTLASWRAPAPPVTPAAAPQVVASITPARAPVATPPSRGPFAMLFPIPRTPEPRSFDAVPDPYAVGASVADRVRACRDSACYIRETDGEPDLSERLSRLRISSLQNAGRQSEAQAEMERFVARFPDSRAAPAYRQSLAARQR